MGSDLGVKKVAPFISDQREEGLSGSRSKRITKQSRPKRRKWWDEKRMRMMMILTDSRDVGRSRRILGLKRSARIESVSDVGGTSVSTGDNNRETEGSKLHELGVNAVSPCQWGTSFVSTVRNTVNERACRLVGAKGDESREIKSRARRWEEEKDKRLGDC